MATTEVQKRASKKYYEKHKDYYRMKSNESMKRIRIERHDYKARCGQLEKENNELRLIYRRTYKKLFENGHDELANYFMAQINDCPTFTVETVDWYEECKKLKSLCVGHEKELRTKDIIIKQIREEYESRYERAINQLDTLLNIMKEQPLQIDEHDTWLENRLLGVKTVLKGEDNDG